VRGAVVDISSGKIFTTKACREELSRPFFAFGPLLTGLRRPKARSSTEYFIRKG
jgi:hypothetical protein